MGTVKRSRIKRKTRLGRKTPLRAHEIERSRAGQAWHRSRKIGPSQKPLKRKSRVNPVNKERRTRVRAETFGPQAALCRTLPCCVCRRPAPSDPAHVRSRGAGGKDRGNVTPLCRYHHDEEGRVGILTFQAKHRIDLWAIAAALEKRAYS